MVLECGKLKNAFFTIQVLDNCKFGILVFIVRVYNLAEPFKIVSIPYIKDRLYLFLGNDFTSGQQQVEALLTYMQQMEELHLEIDADFVERADKLRHSLDYSTHNAIQYRSTPSPFYCKLLLVLYYNTNQYS